MKNFEVKINQNLPSAYELFLFNRPKQLSLQSAEQSISFQLVADGYSYADITIFLNGEDARSPVRAPFGSVQYHKEISSDILEYFLDEVLKYSATQSVSKLKVVNYPDCYSASAELLNNLFLKKGFEIKVSELNYHIPVAASYESYLHDSELRRLRKCEKAGFTLKVCNKEYLEKMFKIIKDTRSRKGYPLSMELNDIQNLFIRFPDDYYAFTLWDGDVLIACSIGVRISAEILYYFLPGDNEMYKNYSPAVQLIKGMYEYCQSNKYNVLDLGISTSGGVRNEGLIRFKENLGAIVSHKYTFEKSFDSQKHE